MIAAYHAVLLQCSEIALIYWLHFIAAYIAACSQHRLRQPLLPYPETVAICPTTVSFHIGLACLLSPSACIEDFSLWQKITKGNHLIWLSSRLWGNKVLSLTQPKEWSVHRDDKSKPFSEMQNERVRSHSHSLQQQKYQLDIRTTFFKGSSYELEGDGQTCRGTLSWARSCSALSRR